MQLAFEAHEAAWILQVGLALFHSLPHTAVQTRSDHTHMRIIR